MDDVLYFFFFFFFFFFFALLQFCSYLVCGRSCLLIIDVIDLSLFSFVLFFLFVSGRGSQRMHAAFALHDPDAMMPCLLLMAKMIDDDTNLT